MAGVCDFVFLVDGTGSMASCIDALKVNLNLFLEELGGPQSAIRDWRGKVVIYRDQEVDGSAWLEDHPFVHNDKTALQAQIARVEAKGGGDEPESLLDALHTLATMEQSDRGNQTPDASRWRHRSDAARVVVIFTDATYKTPMTYPGGRGGTVADLTHAVVGNRLLLFLFAPDHPSYEDLSAIDKSEWQPVAGPDYPGSLASMSRDSAAFQKLLAALAKSVSKTVEAELL